MTKEQLEKEARVFATYYESLFPNEFEMFYKAFFKVAEPREKRIAELEKENTELKNRNSELAGQKASLERWFGEAKNLLNEFVNWANWQGSKCPSFKSIQDKAEQFLKED